MELRCFISGVLIVNAMYNKDFRRRWVTVAALIGFRSAIVTNWFDFHIKLPDTPDMHH